MIFDMQALFSDGQAITATAPSTNVVDLGPVMTPKHAKAPITRDIGKGPAAPIVIQAVEDFAGGDALTVELQISDDEGFGSGVETVVTSGEVPVADLKAGYRFPPLYIPEGVDKRYVRLNFTVEDGPMTAGKITAGWVFGVGNWSA